MGIYNLAVITKAIYNSELSLFTLKTLRDILEIEKESSLFSVVKKLITAGVLLKLEKNKYLLKDARINDFTLANFIYSPSYISFESALNFYGILSQFPYEISSATCKKPVEKTVQGKAFVYVHMKKDLFWGYEKDRDFLIAFPEKALLDQVYLASKGYKKINPDDYDLRKIHVSRLKKYISKYPVTRQFTNAVKMMKNYIKL